MILETVEIILRGALVGLVSSITVGPVAVLCIQRTLSKGRRAGFFSGLGVACADTLMAIIAFFFYSMLEDQIKEYNHIISLIGGLFVIVVGVVIFLQKPSPQIRRNRSAGGSLWRDFGSMFGFTMANFITVIPYLLAFFAMFGISSEKPEELKITTILVGEKQEVKENDALAVFTFEEARSAISGDKPDTIVAKVDTLRANKAGQAFIIKNEDEKAPNVIVKTKKEVVISILSSLFTIVGFLLGATLWWFLVTLLINTFRRQFRPHHMVTINRVAGVIIGLLGIFTLLKTVGETLEKTIEQRTGKSIEQVVKESSDNIKKQIDTHTIQNGERK